MHEIQETAIVPIRGKRSIRVQGLIQGEGNCPPEYAPVRVVICIIGVSGVHWESRWGGVTLNNYMLYIQRGWDFLKGALGKTHIKKSFFSGRTTMRGGVGGLGKSYLTTKQKTTFFSLIKNYQNLMKHMKN